MAPSEVAGFRIQYQMEQIFQHPEQAHLSLLKWATSAGFPFERGPRVLKHLRVDLRNGMIFWCF